MPRFVVRSLCWLATLALAGAAGAQEPAEPAGPPTAFVSRNWVTDDGLPHNVAVRVQQDAVGYIWVATMAGLARFDGQEFKMYAVPGGPASHHRNVRDFAVLPDGSVLFLPATGGVLQVKNDAVVVHPISAQVADETLLQLYVEPGGAIWLEAGQGLVRWENGRIERFGDADGINRRMLHFSWVTDERGRTWVAGADFLGYYQSGKLVRIKVPSGSVYRIAPARAGGFWVYSDALYKWDNESLVRVAGAAWPARGASARCLFEDRAGVLWIATSRAGVFRYDGHRYEPVPNVETGVESVTEDREGDIWLATDGGGIRRLRPRSFTFVETPVTSVTEDADGVIWFAAMSAGVVRRAGHAQDVLPLTVSRLPLYVIAVCADREGRIWMSTMSGVYQFPAHDPTRIRRVDGSLRRAHLLFAARNGDMWAAGPGKFGYYRGDTFTPVRTPLASGEEVTAIAQAPNGLIWVGTSRGNLYKVAGDDLVPVSLPLEARGGTIHVLLADRPETLWIGTTEGLVVMDGPRVRRFTVADGLVDDVVLQLLPDDFGDLWFTTPRGLFRIARAELISLARGTGGRITTVTYGPEQGLAGISPITNEHPSTWADSHGRLWFCTYKGAIGIAADRVQRDAPPTPVLVKEVRIDDHVAEVGRALQVPAGGHRLEFHFAALSFAAPQRVQLRHELEGYDADWVDTAPDRIARYAKVPPGDYRLRVIASNSEGVWNRQGLELPITVLPGWWQTLWFRAGAVVAFAALVGGTARYWSQRKLKTRLDRLEREHALEKERARIARDMHDELGGSVTGINLTVQRLRGVGDAEVAGLIDVLDRRVRRLTVELERVVWTVSPKHGSLEQLASFIERFAHNLLAECPVLCRVLGRETIPALPVSPDVQHHVLAVTKEAINNVLKHSHATTVVIEMSYRDGGFTITIRDDGAGFDPEAHEFSDRNGLRNMRTRVAEVGGTLDIRSAPGSGTSVSIQLPIARAAPNRT